MDNTLCRIRDLYRAIAEFENQFAKAYSLSLNEGMLLCTLLDNGQLSSSEIAEGQQLITRIKEATYQLPELLEKAIQQT